MLLDVGYLHSNMDRFESDRPRPRPRSISNLHSNMDRFERVVSIQVNQDVKKIYIPIWIDLKAVSAAIMINGFSYLHSNMDRFERLSAQDISAAFTAHLHSNMDRFESFLYYFFIFLYQNLHSNMDRFESEDTCEAVFGTSKFTFQYG